MSLESNFLTWFFLYLINRETKRIHTLTNTYTSKQPAPFILNNAFTKLKTSSVLFRFFVSIQSWYIYVSTDGDIIWTNRLRYSSLWVQRAHTEGSIRSFCVSDQWSSYKIMLLCCWDQSEVMFQVHKFFLHAIKRHLYILRFVFRGNQYKSYHNHIKRNRIFSSVCIKFHVQYSLF